MPSRPTDGATEEVVYSMLAEMPAEDRAAFVADLPGQVEVTSCSESGSDAIDATLRAVTPIAEPTGLPEQARTWPS